MGKLSKILALGAAAAIFFASDSPQYFAGRSPVGNNKVSSRSLESVTYEEAKKAVLEQSSDEETIVQAYLDSILRNQKDYDLGIDGWKSFNRFIYDPELKKMYAEYEKRGIKPVASNEKYQDHKKGSLAAATPLFESGKKCDVYISRDCFGKYTEYQDELLSTLDHEACHAEVYHTGGIHLPFDFSEVADFELRNIIHELFGFELQFGSIRRGLRKTSNKFIRQSYNPARILFKELERIADERSDRSRSAQIFYNILLNQPTNQFFVAKEDRANTKPYDLR